jgi:hypothetical protein
VRPAYRAVTSDRRNLLPRNGDVEPDELVDHRTRPAHPVGAQQHEFARKYRFGRVEQVAEQVQADVAEDARQFSARDHDESASSRR